MRATTIRRFIRRLRIGLVTGLLLAALFLLNTLTGCESATDPVPLYGPPPDAGADEDARSLDVISPADLQQEDLQDEDQMRVVYGPPPVDAVTDTPVPEDVQDVFQPPPPYGPPPLDIVEDSPSWDVADVPQPPPPYGPMPIDTIQDDATP